MKRLSTIILTVCAVLFSLNISSQTWTDKLPQEKIENGEELGFFEIQKAFNDYWDPLNVESGYYLENGSRKKAAGWKQFKRWEWFWEMRIDPVTGAFPKTSAAEIRQQMNKVAGVRNADGNWLNLGPSTSPGGYAGLGRLNCVEFLDGDADTYFVGSPSGGLWKTTDAGVSWTVLTDDNDALGVSEVVVISSATPGSETIYIATGDRDGGSLWSLGGNQYHDNNTIGVLKSTDGGTTWATTDLSWLPSDKKTVNRLLKLPSDDDVIFASTTDGVFKTTDGGATWPLLSAVAEFIDMEFKPTDAGVIYGSTRAGKVYKSADGGASWGLKLDVSGAKRIELAVSEDEPGWVYAVVVNTASGLEGIYKSEDSGETWTKVFDGAAAGHNLLGSSCDGTLGGGQGTYDLALVANPDDASALFVGGVNTWKSINGGSAWSLSSHWSGGCGAPTVHADKHRLIYQPGTGDLFECNDSGIYKTSNGGSSWNFLGSGLVISQLYRLGVSQSSSNNVIAGLQDNGTKSLLSGTWTDVIDGDGMECFIDYSDDDTQYGSLYYGRIFRTTDGWSTPRTEITAGLSGAAAWVSPFTIDPLINTTIYVARDKVWKSIDQGDHWAKISDFDAEASFQSMAIAPSDPDTIYVATKTKIWATFDGGTAWSEITGSLPVGSSYITYISVKSEFADTLWVAMGEYNGHGVYESTDAGSTWTNISSGLPSIPVMSVIQNRQNTAEIELYAATDVGVYVKVGSADWALYSEGIPSVVVTELDIYYDDASPHLSRLRAATYGRGLWESELYAPPGSSPIADFTASDLSPLVDSAVVFTDISNNDPTSWAWTFTPATVTYLNGTSSSSQNPEVSFDAAGSYDVKLTVTNASGSDEEMKAAYITAVTAHKWVGTTSIDWNEASNWDLASVPDETNHVIIESGATFYPELMGHFLVGSSGGNFNCKSLTIKSGGLLTVGSASVPGWDMYVYGRLKVESGGTLKTSDDLRIESGGKLFVTGGTIENYVNSAGGYGDFYLRPGSGGNMASGSLTVYSELVVNTGSNWYASGGTLHIGGSESTVTIVKYDPQMYVNDVVVDADVTALISSSSTSPLIVNGSFTQESGSMFSIEAGETLSILGDYLLKSDAAGAASLINSGIMTVSGTSTVERFMTDNQWHLLSSPVGGETANSLYFSGSPKVHLKKYLEPTNTWEFITSLSTPLTQGRGFAYWIDEATFRSDVTVSYEGLLLSTDLTLSSFGYSGDDAHGYNLVGNPFPSAIDWDVGSWDTTDIRGSIWVWEDGGSGDGSGTYLYRNAQGAGSLTDGIIPMAQGFFIQTTSASASLTIPADARVHSAIVYYKSSAKQLSYPYAIFEVKYNNKKDEVWLAFNEGLSDAFDNGWDVNKLFSNNHPQLYIEEANLKLSIDALPLFEGNQRTVRLSFEPDDNGEHTLVLKDIQGMPETEIILEDQLTGSFQNMLTEGNYHFTASKNDDPNRFLLHFNPLTIGIEDSAEPLVNIYASGKVVYINYSDFSAQAVVIVYDMFGREILKQRLNQSQLNTVNVNLNNAAIIVKTIDNENVTVNKLFIR